MSSWMSVGSLERMKESCAWYLFRIVQLQQRGNKVTDKSIESMLLLTLARASFLRTCHRLMSSLNSSGCAPA